MDRKKRYIRGCGVGLLIVAAMVTVFLQFGKAEEEDDSFKYGVGSNCLFISPEGDDMTGDGTYEQPFASLEQARDTIRILKGYGVWPKGGITIYLRQGTYELMRPFTLDKQDSDTTYTSYPGEWAQISLSEESQAENVIQVEKGNNLTFYNLEISGGTADTVYMHQTSESVVERCIIHDSGNAAINIDNQIAITKNQSNNNQIKNNEIYQTGLRGIDGNAAVILKGQNNYIGHNLMYSGLGAAISFAGAGNTIEYNDVSDYLQNCLEMGVLYVPENGYTTENEVKYNYIHDSGQNNTSDVATYGIYLQDMAAGVAISGNVIKAAGSKYACEARGSGYDLKGNLLIDPVNVLQAQWLEDESPIFHENAIFYKNNSLNLTSYSINEKSAISYAMTEADTNCYITGDISTFSDYDNNDFQLTKTGYGYVREQISEFPDIDFEKIGIEDEVLPVEISSMPEEYLNVSTQNAAPGETVVVSFSEEGKKELDNGAVYFNGNVIKQVGDVWAFQMPEKTVIVNAKFSDLDYSKVNFKSNCDEDVSTELIMDGTQVIKPDEPKKEGSYFAGWYSDKECTEPWNFDEDVVSGDMTLYGQWSDVPPDDHTQYILNKEQVTLNKNGSTILTLTEEYEQAPDNVEVHSDNDEVVKVESVDNQPSLLRVTGIEAGQANVEINVGTQVLNCKVTVDNQVAPLEGTGTITLCAYDSTVEYSQIQAENGEVAGIPLEGYVLHVSRDDGLQMPLSFVKKGNYWFYDESGAGTTELPTDKNGKVVVTGLNVMFTYYAEWEYGVTVDGGPNRYYKTEPVAVEPKLYTYTSKEPESGYAMLALQSTKTFLPSEEGKEVSIELSDKEIHLSVGRSGLLTAKIQGISNVTWTCSDESVAMVNNGIVIGKKPGIAIITVQAGNEKKECTVIIE